MIRKSVSIAAVVLLVATGAAPAATPADVQYGEPTSSEQPANLAGAESPDTVGPLPFTGAELGMIGAAGICIIGAGLVLRRIGSKGSRRETQA